MNRAQADANLITALRNAAPVILEIAAAALAWRDQDMTAHRAGCIAAAADLNDPAWQQFENENIKLRDCAKAFDAALDKVRP